MNGVPPRWMDVPVTSTFDSTSVVCTGRWRPFTSLLSTNDPIDGSACSADFAVICGQREIAARAIAVRRHRSTFTHLVGHSACDGLWTRDSIPANVSAPPLAQEGISVSFPLTQARRGGPQAAQASGFRRGQRRGSTMPCSCGRSFATARRGQESWCRPFIST